jgi:hypothetical protein
MHYTPNLRNLFLLLDLTLALNGVISTKSKECVDLNLELAFIFK